MELLRKMGTKKILRIISTGVPYVKSIRPIEGNRVHVVDVNGYIGGTFIGSSYYNNYAIVFPGTDYSGLGLGQVTLINTTVNIGGREYPIVTVGGATWLAENLDFKFTGLSVPTHDAVSTTNPQAVYYNYDEATYGVNGNKYGLLYNGYAVDELVSRAAELTPGWHVATLDDFEALFTAVGGDTNAGLHLKSIAGWPAGGEGLNDFGLTFYPTGYGTDGGGEGGSVGFVQVGPASDADTIIWTQTTPPGQASNLKRAYIFNSSNGVQRPPHTGLYHHVIRLVKDPE